MLTAEMINEYQLRLWHRYNRQQYSSNTSTRAYYQVTDICLAVAQGFVKRASYPYVECQQLA